MKKKLLILLLPLILLGAGCEPMDVSKENDKAVGEFKRCQEAGMRSEVNGYNEIICLPPKI